VVNHETDYGNYSVDATAKLRHSVFSNEGVTDMANHTILSFDGVICVPVERTRSENLEVYFERNGRDKNDYRVTGVKFGSATFATVSDAYAYLGALTIVPEFVAEDEDACEDWVYGYVKDCDVYARDERGY
jgi:hypothetical protein